MSTRRSARGVGQQARGVRAVRSGRCDVGVIVRMERATRTRLRTCGRHGGRGGRSDLEVVGGHVCAAAVVWVLCARAVARGASLRRVLAAATTHHWPTAHAL